MASPRVTIQVSITNSYIRQCLAGIARYTKDKARWRYVGNPLYTDFSAPALDPSECDGAIVYAPSAKAMQRYKDLEIPIVNISGLLDDPQVPTVSLDNEAVGRMGAEHLLSMDLRNLAYLEPGEGPRYEPRRRTFFEVAKEAGANVTWMRVPGYYNYGHWFDMDRAKGLRHFLEELPKPAGIMTAVEALAVHSIDVCDRAEMVVPDDVAVLGVGNDDLLCNFITPTLSSIDVDAVRVGYEAAETLDRLLHGQQVDMISRIQPYDVIQRASTSLISVDDAVVTQALQYIHAHACKGINVADVVNELPLARRAFERRFARAMQRTPLEEIRRIQIDEAKELLEHTDNKISYVARQCGFRDAKYFSKAFRAKVGVPPAQFRDEVQNRSVDVAN